MINSLVLENIYTTNHVKDERGNVVNIFPTETPKIVAEFLYEYIQQYRYKVLIVFEDLCIPSVRKTVSLMLKNRAYQILDLKAKSK